MWNGVELHVLRKFLAFEALNYLYLVPTITPCSFRYIAFSQSREHLHNVLFFKNTGSPCSFVQHKTEPRVSETGSLYSGSFMTCTRWRQNNPLAKWPCECDSQGKPFRHLKLLLNQSQEQFSHLSLPVVSCSGWLCYKIMMESMGRSTTSFGEVVRREMGGEVSWSRRKKSVNDLWSI